MVNYGGWHYNDLSTTAGAPLADFAPIAGYAEGRTQHVDFIQINGLHIYSSDGTDAECR